MLLCFINVYANMFYGILYDKTADLKSVFILKSQVLRFWENKN